MRFYADIIDNEDQLPYDIYKKSLAPWIYLDGDIELLNGYDILYVNSRKQLETWVGTRLAVIENITVAMRSGIQNATAYLWFPNPEQRWREVSVYSKRHYTLTQMLNICGLVVGIDDKLAHEHAYKSLVNHISHF